MDENGRNSPKHANKNIGSQKPEGVKLRKKKKKKTKRVGSRKTVAPPGESKSVSEREVRHLL